MLKVIDCIEGLRELDDNSIDTIVTSPPYNKKGLIGKVTPGNQHWQKFNIDYATYDDNMPEDEYKQWQIELLNECHRVIKDDGSIFYNHKPRRHKNRSHLPWDFIQHSNASLYQLIIWDRRNSPNIRKDILVPSTEHIYWLCKDKPKVYREQVDNTYRGEVWVIPPDRQKEHPAPFPPILVETCIKLTTQVGDIVLDPFMGSGTTALVAQNNNREWLGFEIDEKYAKITEDRIKPTGRLPL